MYYLITLLVILFFIEEINLSLGRLIYILSLICLQRIKNEESFYHFLFHVLNKINDWQMELHKIILLSKK